MYQTKRHNPDETSAWIIWSSCCHQLKTVSLQFLWTQNWILSSADLPATIGGAWNCYRDLSTTTKAQISPNPVKIHGSVICSEIIFAKRYFISRALVATSATCEVISIQSYYGDYSLPCSCLLLHSSTIPHQWVAKALWEQSWFWNQWASMFHH